MSSSLAAMLLRDPVRLSRREVLRLAALAGLGAACRLAPAAPTRGGAIRIAIGTEPDSLDPAGQTTTLVMNVVDYMVETLTRVDEEGKTQPLLAERWETSADGKTHTFHLRKGVTFHDGAPLDATAVKASLGRFLDPSLRVPQRALPDTLIDRIDVVDSGTVRIGPAALAKLYCEASKLVWDDAPWASSGYSSSRSCTPRRSRALRPRPMRSSTRSTPNRTSVRREVRHGIRTGHRRQAHRCWHG